ncbi:MAG: hypothetical protein JNJ73_20490 [Hyphomonadaceae bacterium]|nr:hypothetical protein [Hyphomonadaceae bacterium]
MVMLVHLAPAKLQARIRRGGLKTGENLFGAKGERDLYAFRFWRATRSPINGRAS